MASNQTQSGLAVYPKDRKVQVQQVPHPSAPQRDEVLIAIQDVGICGTDREITSFEYGIPPAQSEYLILGHEGFARIKAVGPEVKNLKVGDWVVPIVRRPCDDPSCRACRAGRQDFCYTGRFFERGIKGLNGFMVEETLDVEKYLVPVPESLREIAVLTEPLTIAEKALDEIFRIQSRLPWARGGDGQGPGECRRALVFGAGTVGLLGCLLFLSKGYDVSVYSLEAKDSFKAKWVEGVGARYISAADKSPEILARSENPFDLIYEATGASAVAFNLIPSLDANGIYVLTGVPSLGKDHSIDTDLMMRRLVLENQVLFGSVNASRSAYVSAVRDLEEFWKRWPDSVKHLIARRIPLPEAAQAVTHKLDGIKNVIRVAPPL